MVLLTITKINSLEQLFTHREQRSIFDIYNGHFIKEINSYNKFYCLSQCINNCSLVVVRNGINSQVNCILYNDSNQILSFDISADVYIKSKTERPTTATTKILTTSIVLPADKTNCTIFQCTTSSDCKFNISCVNNRCDGPNKFRCETNGTVYSLDSRNYKYFFIHPSSSSSSWYTWDNARIYCANIGAQLLVIDDTYELSVLQDLLNNVSKMGSPFASDFHRWVRITDIYFNYNLVSQLKIGISADINGIITSVNGSLASSNFFPSAPTASTCGFWDTSNPNDATPLRGGSCPSTNPFICKF